jgi:hypothetical protein
MDLEYRNGRSGPTGVKRYVAMRRVIGGACSVIEVL